MSKNLNALRFRKLIPKKKKIKIVVNILLLPDFHKY